MKEPQPTPNSLDETLVIDQPKAVDGGTVTSAVERVRELIQGSTPSLREEERALVAARLRVVSLLLFAGFLAFLIRSLLFADDSSPPIVLITHVLATVVAGVIGLRLCMKCEHALKHVRIAEVLVFGSAAVFFVIITKMFLDTSIRKGYVVPIVSPWQMLIFAYAMFIPNSTRRAALVIGLLAASPVLITWQTQLTSPRFVEIIANSENGRGSVAETIMVMALASAIAIWGAASRQNLRRVAYEARQLGQYRLKEQLGAGGMGEVYLAEHMLLKRPCAVKVIRPDKAGNQDSLSRFEREVRAAAGLTHWNTIDIYDYGRTPDGTFYYVMELLRGESLQRIVDEHGPMPPGRVAHFLRQACHALREAHSAGLVHRDLKPANLFAAECGGVFDVLKVLDFGLVKHIITTESSVSTAGQIIGSPLYMSPEQAEGSGELDGRSDIYSVGATAFFLLTGQPPFPGENAVQVMIAHARDTPPDLAEVAPGTPDDLQKIVSKTLSKAPSDRFANTDELLEALQACESTSMWNDQLASAWWVQHPIVANHSVLR